jgi:hypothetical protein
VIADFACHDAPIFPISGLIRDEAVRHGLCSSHGCLDRPSVDRADAYEAAEAGTDPRRVSPALRGSIATSRPHGPRHTIQDPRRTLQLPYGQFISTFASLKV